MSTSLLLIKLFFFRKKNLFFENLLTLNKKLSVVWEQSFSRVIKTAFYVSRWNLREKLFRNLFLSFIFFIHEQKNLNFRWKLFHSPSKLYPTCGRQQLEKKCDSLLYRNITIFGVSVKVFPRGSSKLHFIYSQPTFEHLINIRWKICIWKFFGKWAKIFQTGGKKARGDWQESMLHVRRKLLVSHTFFEKNVSFCKMFGSLS